MLGILSRNASNQVPRLRLVWSSTFVAPCRTFSNTVGQLDSPSSAHKARLDALQETSADPFPRLQPSPAALSVKDFLTHFSKLQPSESATEDNVQLHGRITRIRTAGSKLVFVDLLQGQETVQTLCSFKDLEHVLDKSEYKRAFKAFQKGDIVQANGKPQRTPSGELSLRLSRIPRLLSPCLHAMPEALLDNETRMRKRHVDLRINKRLSSVVRARAGIQQYIRDYLLADQHVEVQTPILNDGAGGAIARSFVTAATEFPEKRLNLRIAPELWLKRLIVGGLDRVFEIGPSFRNEGLDVTHNPEFTTCEFYRSFTDIEKLIEMTEVLFSGLAAHVKKIQSELGLDLDIPDTHFQGPYKRLDFIPDIELRSGSKFPDLGSVGAVNAIRDILKAHSISHNDGNTLPQLLDHLAAHFLEPECNEPTWIINHPECMSPLAKSFVHPGNGQVVSARGELFVHKKEVVNTYEEENSPIEQRRKFEQQVAYRNDENEAYVDESYLEVLEWGMPPTGGWGCGIDRLCMLLTGSKRISDVLTFGNLRNVVSLRQTESK